MARPPSMLLPSALLRRGIRLPFAFMCRFIRIKERIYL